jgi:predicted neutral ceramidase superfamily lipid hydrolase
MSDNPNPSIPAVADLFTPRQRSLIYLLSVVAAAAYAVVAANTELHYGILAAYAGWNALVGLLAVSNTPSMRRGNDAGQSLIQLLWAVVLVLAAVALFVWLLREL